VTPAVALRLPRSRQARLDAALAAVCTAQAAACVLLLPLAHIHVAPRSLLVTGGLAALLAALHTVYHRRDARLAAMVRAIFWGLVLSNEYAGPMYLAARVPSPLRDAALASADRALGLPAASVVAWAAHHPWLQRALDVSYDSLIALSFLALIVPPLLSQNDESDELLVALALGIVASLAVLAVWPAIGPWASEALAPSAAQAATGRALLALKAGAPVTLDFSAPEPIVSVPSWHTILAVLSAAALRRVRVGRVVAALWAAVIVLSTLTTGWHYLVDVAAGVAVALGAQRLAARIVRAMSVA
jgi:membrane-associated phospholipid phosphatase